MERLTHRRMSDGAVCANIEESKVLTDFPEFTQKVYDRLAEYEETGLTPSEIKQLKGECFGCKVDAQRYKQAESNGRLILLPCKTGDTIWDREVEPWTVVSIEWFSSKVTQLHCVSPVTNLRKTFSVGRRSLGRIIFLTRDDAKIAFNKEK